MQTSLRVAVYASLPFESHVRGQGFGPGCIPAYSKEVHSWEDVLTAHRAHTDKAQCCGLRFAAVVQLRRLDLGCEMVRSWHARLQPLMRFFIDSESLLAPASPPFPTSSPTPAPLFPTGHSGIAARHATERLSASLVRGKICTVICTFICTVVAHHIWESQYVCGVLRVHITVHAMCTVMCTWSATHGTLCMPCSGWFSPLLSPCPPPVQTGSPLTQRTPAGSSLWPWSASRGAPAKRQQLRPVLGGLGLGLEVGVGRGKRGGGTWL